MNKPIQITVGAGGYNPIAGTTDYNNPDLAGVDGFVDKSGYGTWKYQDYQLLSGGGFRLLNGFKFIAGEVFFFHPTGIVYNSSVSNYTNGFNYSLVMQSRFSRIGFRQSTKGNYTTLVDSSNLTATSNRYYNDFHAVATAANLKDSQEDPAIGNIAFNNYLSSLKKSVIMRYLNGIFSESEYIEQVLLYDRTIAARNEAITNSGLFVGYAINVAQVFDKAVQVNGATLLFDTDCNVTLHLFKDGKKTSIWSQQVSAVANEPTLIEFSDLVLNYITNVTKGSLFYLGYFQNEIQSQSAKAINENTVSWSPSICFGAVPFSSVATGNDFDRNQISRTRVTWGLNLEISSFNDWTQIIVKRPNLFDEVEGLMMAFTIIEIMIYAFRSNRDERLIKEGLQLASLIQDLSGTAPVPGAPVVTGLNKRIEREMKRVKDSLLPKQKAISVSLTGAGFSNGGGRGYNFYQNPLPANVNPHVDN